MLLGHVDMHLRYRVVLYHRSADCSQGTEGKVIRGAKGDGILGRGRVRQFFIGIHSAGNLNDIRADLAAAGYDVLCVYIAFL
eukprot:COSAG06_NODE_835_length_12032_cov_5.757060_10_plen_82_part_00